jgi:hypothetical protein
MTAQDPAQRPTAAEVVTVLTSAAAEHTPTPDGTPETGALTEVLSPPTQANDAGTRRLPAPPPRPPKAPPHAPRRRQRQLIIGAVAALVVVLAVVLLALVRPASNVSSPPPSQSVPASPSIPGPLGTHIAQLERSVRP